MRLVVLLLCVLVPMAHAAGDVQPLNLGLAARALAVVPADVLGIELVLATVSEAGQGEDLNGDGDVFDEILFAQWEQRPAVNLGLVVEASPDEVQLLGRQVVLPVSELATGEDFNGDHDIADQVLHALGLVGGEFVVRNLGLPVFDGASSGVLGLVTVSEASAGGEDLNRDGDANDLVAHLLEATTGELTVSNLGFAVDSSLPLLVTEGAVGFAVRESAQGAEDLNGDNDTSDSVLHTFTPGDTGALNSGLALHNFADGLAARASRFAFAVSESGQGQDLNGDADLSDRVMHVVNARDGSLLNTGFANLTKVHFGERFLVFLTSESSQGGASLNGDFDATDWVPVIVGFPSETVTAIPFSAWSIWEGSDRGFAFHMSEWTQGQFDIDGDGSKTDNWVMTYDHTTGQVTNTGVKSFFLNLIQAGGDGIVAGVNEGRMDLDLNGDGDKADNVAHGYDWDSGVLTNFGIQANAVTASGGLFAWSTHEAGQGDADLNGDGDFGADNVAFLSTTSEVFNTGLAIDVSSSISFPWVLLSPGTVLVSCSEEDQGDADLNGDDDALDGVLHRVDLGLP